MRLSRHCAIAALLGASLQAGCVLGPDYHRPATESPTAYRFDPSPVPNSFADDGWWEIYQDPTLRELLREALANNLDVRIAAARIEQARAVLGTTRLQQLPEVSASAGAQREQLPQYERQLGAQRIGKVFSLEGSLSYEIDFWGKYRRATEAARAQLLASEYARDDVTASLVSSVATAYFTLRAMDEQLVITRRTIDTRRKFVELTRAQHERGTVSGLDVVTAEAQLALAQANLPDLQRQIGQAENQLSVLLGHNPAEVLRGQGDPQRMDASAAAPTPPAGLPSALLERRPDVREAEQTLIAANAQVGVARADLFPSITLTATGGVASTALSDLFHAPANTWSIGSALLQPLLSSQRNTYQVQLADAQKREALLSYQQSVQVAFQEVADALIARQKYGEFQVQQQAQVDAQRKASAIALARYRVGYASYFDVINADANLFTAEISLSAARLNSQLSVVQLYRALGGGWQGN